MSPVIEVPALIGAFSLTSLSLMVAINRRVLLFSVSIITIENKGFQVPSVLVTFLSVHQKDGKYSAPPLRRKE